MNKTDKNKPLWIFPWGLKESYAIVGGLFVVSLFLEGIVPFSTLPKPQYPVNAILLGCFALAVILFYKIGKNSYIFQWFSSAHAAIASISYFTLLVLLMGLIPQHNSGAGLLYSFLNLLNSWQFFFATLFMLLCLGTTTVKRIFPIKLRNITFTLNHSGLWLALAAGYFGATDKIEAIMHVDQGEIVWYGTNRNKTIELPIAIELQKFTARFYTPQIVLSGEKKVIHPNHEYQLSDLPVLNIDNLTVNIDRFLSRAFPTDTTFIDARGVPFTGAAAHVSVKDSEGTPITSGWLAYPTRTTAEKTLPLPDGRIIRMLPPQPSYFGSEIKLYSKKSESVCSGTVEVNAPMTIDGWWVYQYGYDNLAGQDSPFSSFKVVYDPWFGVVFLGFILMLVGVVLMVFVHPLKIKSV